MEDLVKPEQVHCIQNEAGVDKDEADVSQRVPAWYAPDTVDFEVIERNCDNANQAEDDCHGQTIDDEW